MRGPEGRPVEPGGVWWVELADGRGHEQRGRRPMLVLSKQRFNERSETAIMMVLTTQPPKRPTRLMVDVGSIAGSRKTSWAKVSQVRTLSTARFDGYLGKVTPEQLSECIAQLQRLLEARR